MSDSTAQRNKAFVLEAFETLFNRKDFVAAEKFWSSNYIQHSAHIPQGRDGLFGLIKSTPPEMKYENSLIMAEGDMLMLRQVTLVPHGVQLKKRSVGGEEKKYWPAVARAEESGSRFPKSLSVRTGTTKIHAIR
jgi:hypothetical protein